MNWLDLALLVSALSFAFSGYRQGFVVGVLAFTGFLDRRRGRPAARAAGGLLARARGSASRCSRSAIVLLAATVGQVTLGWLGALVRGPDHLAAGPGGRRRDGRRGQRGRDARHHLVPRVVAAARTAAVAVAGDQRLAGRHRRRPGDARAAPARCSPRSARCSTTTSCRPCSAASRPSGSARCTRRRPGITVDRRGAPGRGQRGEGQRHGRRRAAAGWTAAGFVDLPEARAHQRARGGRRRPAAGPGRPARATRLDARVVVFDPQRDLAILYVPDLSAPALDLDDSGGRGDQAVVAGFPGGGPFRLGAGPGPRHLNARGPDIYHRTQITREVFSLYADVEPGNSGGPLLSLDGRRLRRHLREVAGRPADRLRPDGRRGPPVVKAGRGRHPEVDTDTCA